MSVQQVPAQASLVTEALYKASSQAREKGQTVEKEAMLMTQNTTKSHIQNIQRALTTRKELSRSI